VSDQQSPPPNEPAAHELCVNKVAQDAAGTTTSSVSHAVSKTPEASASTAVVTAITGPSPAVKDLAAKSEAETSDSEDVVLLAGQTEDGQGLRVLRKRKSRLEVGVVMPLVPGKPIVGEVVRLEPRKEMPLLCDVHVEYAPPAETRPTSKGPAQVASARYRANWDNIFNAKSAQDKSLN
jgi:hypothetical protein